MTEINRYALMMEALNDLKPEINAERARQTQQPKPRTALPMLGEVLAARHGFECRVTFSVDPETGCIDPEEKANLPGLDALERAEEQLHQRADFLFGPPPVLAGEREQGQCLDAGFEAEVDADVHRAGAGAMADHARPATPLRPAAVAVHDDCDVPRQLRGARRL